MAVSERLDVLITLANFDDFRVRFAPNVNGLPSIDIPKGTDPIHYRTRQRIPCPDRCVNGKWGAPKDIRCEVVGYTDGVTQHVAIFRDDGVVEMSHAPVGVRIFPNGY